MPLTRIEGEIISGARKAIVDIDYKKMCYCMFGYTPMQRKLKLSNVYEYINTRCTTGAASQKSWEPMV